MDAAAVAAQALLGGTEPAPLAEMEAAALCGIIVPHMLVVAAVLRGMEELPDLAVLVVAAQAPQVARRLQQAQQILVVVAAAAVLLVALHMAQMGALAF